MEAIKVSAIIPIDCETLFKAWLSSKEHSNFTGGTAKMSSKLNSKYSAWNGYISGKTIELIPNTKIVQTWRSTDFSDVDPDSVLELKLEKRGKSTILHLHHYNIPKGQGKKYKSGWKEHYLEPMKKYFSAK